MASCPLYALRSRSFQLFGEFFKKLLPEAQRMIVYGMLESPISSIATAGVYQLKELFKVIFKL